MDGGEGRGGGGVEFAQASGVQLRGTKPGSGAETAFSRSGLWLLFLFYLSGLRSTRGAALRLRFCLNVGASGWAWVCSALGRDSTLYFLYSCTTEKKTTKKARGLRGYAPLLRSTS